MIQLNNLMNPSRSDACRSPMGVAIGKLTVVCIPPMFLILRNTVPSNYSKLESFEGLFVFLINYWTLLCVTFILYRIVQEDRLTAQTRVEFNDEILFKCDEKSIQKFLMLYTKGKIGRRELAIMWLMEGNNFDLFISKMKRDFGDFISLCFERIFLEHNLINTSTTVSQSRTVKKESSEGLDVKIRSIRKNLKIFDGKLFTTTKFLELLEGEMTIKDFSSLFEEWKLLPLCKRIYSELLAVKHTNFHEYDKIISFLKMKHSFLVPRSQGPDWGPFSTGNTKSLEEALIEFKKLMEHLNNILASFDVSGYEEGNLLKSIFSNSDFATLIRMLVTLVFGNNAARGMAVLQICSLNMFRGYTAIVDGWLTGILDKYSKPQTQGVQDTPLGLAFDKLINLFFSNYIKDHLPEYWVFLADVFKHRYYRFAVTTDFFVTLSEFLAILFKNINTAIAERNPLLILGINGLDSMEEEVLKCEEIFKKVFFGPSASLSEMPVILARLHKSEAKYRKLKFITDGEKLKFRSLYSRLAVMIDKAERVGKDNRVPPLGFIITGSPGIGKTLMVESFESAYKLRTGIPDFINVLFNYADTKHQELPPITKVFHMNDYFAVKEEHMTSTAVLSFLQQAVDSHPFSLERASIEDKKDSKIAPIIVFVSTNAKDYRIIKATGSDKLIRRYKVIKGFLTEDAKHMARDLGIPEDELLANRGIAPEVKDTLVCWNICTLAVRDPETLLFDSEENVVIRQFTSKAKLIHYLVESAISNYDEKVAAVADLSMDFCQYCESYGPHRCAREENIQFANLLPEQQVKIEDIDAYMKKMRDEGIEADTIPLTEIDEIFDIPNANKMYRLVVFKYHPDKGGDAELCAIFNRFKERYDNRIEATLPGSNSANPKENLDNYKHLAKYFDLYFIPNYVRQNKWFNFFMRPVVDNFAAIVDDMYDLELNPEYNNLVGNEKYDEYAKPTNFFKWTIRRMDHSAPTPWYKVMYNQVHWLARKTGIAEIHLAQVVTMFFNGLINTVLRRPFDFVRESGITENATLFFIDQDLIRDVQRLEPLYDDASIVNIHLFPSESYHTRNINLIFKKDSLMGRLYMLGVKEPSLIDMLVLFRLIKEKKIEMYEADRFFKEWERIYHIYAYLTPQLKVGLRGLVYTPVNEYFKHYLANLNVFWVQCLRASEGRDVDLDFEEVDEAGLWCYSNHSLRVNLTSGVARDGATMGMPVDTFWDVINILRDANRRYLSFLLIMNIVFIPISVPTACLFSVFADFLPDIGISYDKRFAVKCFSSILVFLALPFPWFLTYIWGSSFASYNYFEQGMDPGWMNGVNHMLRRIYIVGANRISLKLLQFFSRQAFTIKRQRNFLAAILVISTALSIYSMTRAKTIEQKEVEIVGESPQKTKEVNKYVNENVSMAAAGWVCGKSAAYRTEELDESIIVKCTATTDNKAYTLHGIFLCNNFYLFPSHLFNNAVTFKTVITIQGSNTTALYSDADYYQFPDEDLCIYRFLGGTLLRPQGIDIVEDAKLGPAVIKKSNVNIGKLDVPITLQTGPNFKHTITYSYGNTVDGDCGLPLRNLDNKIIGIHIAATGTYYGHAAMFNRDKLMKAMEENFKVVAPINTTSSQSLIVMNGSNYTYAKKPMFIGPHQSGALFNMIKFNYFRNQLPPFTILGNINNTNTPKMTGRRSVLYEFFKDNLEEEFIAPKLRSWEKDGRWTGIAINKFTVLDYHETLYSSALMDFAVADYLSDIPAVTVQIHPYTLDSIINGDPRHPWMKSRDDSKSVGISLNSKGIRHLELDKEEKKILEPKFYEEYDELIRIFEKEDHCSIIVNIKAVIKDELIAESKVEKGKGRWFYVSDVAFNIFYSRYIKPVMLFCLQHMYWSNIFGTVNATSKDWKTLYNHLIEYNDKGFEFDQEGFDLHHRLFIEPYIQTIVSISQHIGYTIKEQLILKRVMISAFNQLANLDNELVFLNYGLASGRCDTMFCNSVIHSLLYYYAFRRLNGPNHNPRNYLRLAIVGDDTLLTIKKGSNIKFEGEEIKKIMYDVGYILTSARKDGSLLLDEKVEKLTFLKRTFNIEGDNVFAPLSLKSIYKTLCFHLELNCTLEEWQRGVLLSTQRELFMHGKDVFLNFQEDLRTKNISFEELKYENLLREYDDGSFTTLGSLTMAPVFQMIDVSRF